MNKGKGVSIYTVVWLVIVAFRVFGVIDWKWFWVMAPLTFPACFLASVAIFAIIMATFFPDTIIKWKAKDTIGKDDISE